VLDGLVPLLEGEDAVGVVIGVVIA
jgi:hypothetical protein